MKDIIAVLYIALEVYELRLCCLLLIMKIEHFPCAFRPKVPLDTNDQSTK